MGQCHDDCVVIVSVEALLRIGLELQLSGTIEIQTCHSTVFELE